MNYILGLILSIMLAFCSVLAQPSRAQAGPTYEKLKADYLSLRNTDVEIQRSNEWSQLASQLIEYADKHPSEEKSASVLMNAGILYEQLFRKLGGADRLEQACQTFARLAQDFPGHNLVDDALVKLGDLELYEKRDSDGATRSFTEVVEAYPDSDMVEVARARLKSIKNGKLKRENKISARISADKPVIVIDPGHGGEDFGAIGVAGLLEKDVVLDVSLRLAKLLEAKGDLIVRLTRRSDVFVPLAERTNLANDFEADVFLSLHSNASPNQKLRGFEVYYLDNTDDQSSRKLAERENRAVLGGQTADQDVSFILSDLIQSAKLDDSITLAHTIHDSVHNAFQERWDGYHDFGVKKAPFYVLVGAHMPCALAELFFIDHPIDGARLADPKFREDLARALALGVKEFLGRVALRSKS